MPVSEKERSGSIFIVMPGVDLGRNFCRVVGLDAAGPEVVRHSLRRQTLIDNVAKMPACAVAMETCCGRSSSGSAVRSARARDPADVAGVGAAVGEGPEER
jgi:hypothetical protein